MRPLAQQISSTRLTFKTAARCIVAFAMASICAQALAQYVWTDEKGVRQYSDQPPPASVPNSRIIRGKGMPVPAASASAEAGSKAGAASTGNTPAASAPSLAERNADFNKRRAQQAANEKKAADEEKLSQQKKTNCERAANYKRTLESGMRVSRTDANGERAVLTDEERAQELRQAQQMLDSCKG